MENNFAPELIEKAKSAKSPSELLNIAKENNIELTPKEAAAYFVQIKRSGEPSHGEQPHCEPSHGELSDDELDNVAGGGCGNDEPKKTDMHYLLDDPNFKLVNTKCPACGGQVGIYEYPGETIFICIDCGNNAVKYY